MPKNLVIVESPAKAKTIQKYLGKDFEVVSCFGHIADLPKKNMGVAIDKNFQPTYEVSPDKKEIVKSLKEKAKKSEKVWLASDEDREGEAISWHLMQQLKLDEEKTHRIVFHEITEKAIKKAVENPRKLDMNLVNAQQARRILDRIVGFELSPILWKKVKAGLSAGRVQSVAVRLVVEREEEYQAFVPTSVFKVDGFFVNATNETIKAKLNSDFESYAEALGFLENIQNKSFFVGDIEKKPGKRTPAAPFTTSTLQQEASHKLGFSVSRTMRLAQDLYEAGFITYMRTDSVNLSQDFLTEAGNYIQLNFGKKYHQKRTYVTKSKGAQEAHEAIRPTNVELQKTPLDDAHNKLYQLIWRRALASQMADAQLEKTQYTIQTEGVKEHFIATGEVIVFDGFLKVYQSSTEADEEENNGDKDTILPKVEKGEHLKTLSIVATERFNKPPARYSEASLVRKLEELGIGRPSTYAPTLTTIQQRGYVEIRDFEPKQRTIKKILLQDNQIIEKDELENYGSEKRKFFPTDLGKIVTKFLTQNFQEVLDYQFTAKLEEEFDIIASGGKQWTSTLQEFYNHFHPVVMKVEQSSEKVKGERILGIDPKTQKPIIAKIGRYGPMVQLGSADDPEKPKFASIPKSISLEEITLEQAISLFELPRKLGEYDGKPVEVNNGRFGPYVKNGDLFVSLKTNQGDDAYTITLERAIELIEEKKSLEKNKIIHVFETEDTPIEVLNGRWGPYIKHGKENYKIPKDIDAATLDLVKVREIMEGSSKKTVKNKK